MNMALRCYRKNRVSISKGWVASVKFRVTKRKKHFLVLSAVIAVLMLLFRPIIFHHEPMLETIDDATSKVTRQIVPEGYVFSVTVADRHYALARKVKSGQYELMNTPLYHDLQLCQKVKTTGFDQQFKPDILIGRITSIKSQADDIFATVMISKNDSCRHQ